MYVLGIDVGTQGARAIVTDLDGHVEAEAQCPFAVTELVSTQPGHFEQNPLHWREAAWESIGAVVARFVAAGHDAETIAGLSVTSTSGTLCLVDEQGAPVGAAMMYSDSRSSESAERVQAAGATVADKLGSRFNASYALSKLCWVQEHEPHRLQRARWFLSPTDLIVGWLSGIWGITDWTNALKWGYDVLDLIWPRFIFETLGLPDRFPRVVPPGAVLGAISPQAAERTGLSPRTQVVAGATDGTASQLASGAVSPGDWNSTLGTTLVLKGVSTSLLRDPLGRLYCHRHPDGYWLPGGASSTGADCLALRFPAERLAHLNQAALARSPTDLIIYPLTRRGERLPFVNAAATGFVLGAETDEETLYAAHLEGLAYVERMCYEVVESLGTAVRDPLFVVGGATQSQAGLQIRADVSGRSLRLPEVPLGAMGAAILAARGVALATVQDAVRQMVRFQQTVWPREAHRAAYAERYGRFVAACRERGYV